MTYYESAEGQTISKARAEKEVIDHGADVFQFLEDCGDKAEYDAQVVLDWLGY